MMDESTPQSSQNTVTFLYSDQVDNRLKDPLDKEPAIDVIRECKAVMEKVPDGKRGVVIGSGRNTFEWSQRGWETFDIDRTFSPTYVADANSLSLVLPDDSFDYVLTEHLTMNKVAGKKIEIGSEGEFEPAVGFEQLLDQSKKVLKKGGILIMDFIDYGRISEVLEKPSADEYTRSMACNGFYVIAVPEDPLMYEDPDRGLKGGTRLMLYAKKN